MATAAKAIEGEMYMEERLVRLETTTEFLRRDIGRVESKVDKLDEKIDGVAGELASFRLETKDLFAKVMKGRMADKIWWLLIGGAILGVVARGFKWI